MAKNKLAVGAPTTNLGGLLPRLAVLFALQPKLLPSCTTIKYLSAPLFGQILHRRCHGVPIDLAHPCDFLHRPTFLEQPLNGLSDLLVAR